MRYLTALAILGSSLSCGQAQTPPPPGKLVKLRITSTLVPSPAALDVLLPPGYEQLSQPMPLFIWLHDGISGKDVLGKHIRPFVEKAWATNDLMPCAVVAPVTGASFSIDWHDGTNQWDRFITGQMLTYLRENYHVKQDRTGTAIADKHADFSGITGIETTDPSYARTRRCFQSQSDSALASSVQLVCRG